MKETENKGNEQPRMFGTDRSISVISVKISEHLPNLLDTDCNWQHYYNETCLFQYYALTYKGYLQIMRLQVATLLPGGMSTLVLYKENVSGVKLEPLAM